MQTAQSASPAAPANWSSEKVHPNAPLTPLVDVVLRIGPQWRHVGLKLESHNPGGSIKYRTARGLVKSLEEQGRLRTGASLVESTSGNLGVALALLSRARGYRFTAVTDPKTDPVVLERIEGLGARVMRVTEPDMAGGYLLSRLSAVRKLLAQEPGTIWPNQYENPSNPAAHYSQTAPEIQLQCPDLDAVFVATSTGGTLAGVGRYFREVAPLVKVIGVDLRGSRVFGLPSEHRLVTGIGSSRPSSFLRPDDYDDVIIVDDLEAISACYHLRDELGVGLGGSSGAVVAACARYLAENPHIRRPVCICPDGHLNYVNTLYNPVWLAKHHLIPRSDFLVTDLAEEVRWIAVPEQL
jgi:cysteine synthase A